MSAHSLPRSRRWRFAVAGVAAAALALVAVPAFADNVKDDLKASGPSSISLDSTGTAQTTIQYYVQATGSCDITDPDSPSMWHVDVPSGVIASPADISFTTCDTDFGVTITATTAGTKDIGLSYVSGPPLGNSDAHPAGVTLTVSAYAGGAADTDADDDGVADDLDNCPADANPDQADADGDGLGNVCDANAYAPAVLTDALNTTGPEGTEQTNAGAFSDTDGNGTLTISGTGAGTVTDNHDGTWSWSYTPSDNGTGTVTVSATDGEHTAVVDTFTWTASNVAPTISGVSVGGSGTACIGGNNVTLDYSFADPGTSDTWDIDIDWGDSTAHTTVNDTSSLGSQPQASHNYAAGNYTITVTVTDDDNGSDTDTSGVVNLAYVMSGILPPFNADGSSIWKYGSTIPVKVTVTDCSAKPVPGLELHVGTQLKSSSDPSGAIGESASTSAADTTGILRYDPSAGQYIYNFASKNLTDGNAKYVMYVRGANVIGKSATGASTVGQSYQDFGLKSK